MKVAVLIMKGFDGCGVSRFAIEHQKELRKQGHECTVYSFDKKYSRSKAHDDADVIYYKDIKELTELNDMDYLVLNSYPKELIREDFEFVKGLKPVKIGMMHELVRQNVSRIKGAWEWIEMVDIVSSFSEEMDFVQDLRKKLPGKKYFSFRMGTSNDELDQLFNDSLSKEKAPRLVYFGRASGMKDPERLFTIKEHDKQIESIQLGIERSIGAVKPIFGHPLAQAMKGYVSTFDDFEFDKHDFSKVQIYGPSNRLVGLELLAQSKFGASFYKTRKINNLGNRMEYTQIEISCVTLPLFDIAWGKNVRDVETGKTFFELGNNAIYSDKENIQGTIDEMHHLLENPEEYEIRRRNIFELTRRNYNSEAAVKHFYQNVNLLMSK